MSSRGSSSRKKESSGAGAQRNAARVAAGGKARGRPAAARQPNFEARARSIQSRINKQVDAAYKVYTRAQARYEKQPTVQNQQKMEQAHTAWSRQSDRAVRSYSLIYQARGLGLGAGAKRESVSEAAQRAIDNRAQQFGRIDRIGALTDAIKADISRGVNGTNLFSRTSDRQRGEMRTLDTRHASPAAHARLAELHAAETKALNSWTERAARVGADNFAARAYRNAGARPGRNGGLPFRGMDTFTRYMIASDARRELAQTRAQIRAFLSSPDAQGRRRAARTRTAATA